MALVGVISRQPRLSLADWKDCFAASDVLVTTRPRQLMNPFTRAPQVLQPSPFAVEMVIDGDLVGAIEPSPEFDEDGELHVYAPDEKRDRAKEIADGVARSMSARLEWLADL